MKFNNYVEVCFVDKEGKEYGHSRHPNLVVDDGMEYILDFMCGIATWHNYMNEDSYGTGMVGLWNTTRYVGVGTCAFNNASSQRAFGRNALPTGTCATGFLIEDTLLVSNEDSTLSREVGTRVQPTKTREDQTVELAAEFTVPGDIPSGTEIREYGFFLSSSGPAQDPSYHDASKPNTMLCRAVRYTTGVCGGTGIYLDDPLVANDTIRIRWKVSD